MENTKQLTLPKDEVEDLVISSIRQDFVDLIYRVFMAQGCSDKNKVQLLREFMLNLLYGDWMHGEETFDRVILSLKDCFREYSKYPLTKDV